MADARTEKAEEACPSALLNEERAAIAQRRRENHLPLDGPVVGVALSGGGIRSATFCLGLFQALARAKLVRRVDYLSTVSGGGYFGSFLGAAFTREAATTDAVERELANNHSWPVNWLRENGRFLSPNGSGDNWLTAAVALRNWAALHFVLLSFPFFLIGLGVLIRVDLSTTAATSEWWRTVEHFFWERHVLRIWWSPWMALPAIPFAALMVPAAILYWGTQMTILVSAIHHVAGLASRSARSMSLAEFTSRLQNALTRGFMIGLVSMVALLGYAVIDSLGQTAYLRWSAEDFAFPSLWATLTGTGLGLFGFAAKLVLYLERFLGTKRVRITFDVIALGLALLWLLLIFFGLSVLACAFAWEWTLVWDSTSYRMMSGGWSLLMAVLVAFFCSWIFSRSFGFVNLSSMQQMYAARLSRAYLGATNPLRRKHANHSMTDLIPGDEISLEDYTPHRQGGPLHLINVTVNETISGRTHIERRDRKGLPMAIGPCGLSVGIDGHALWAPPGARRAKSLVQALWDQRKREIVSLPGASPVRHALAPTKSPRSSDSGRDRPNIEALSIGRWVAVSGAAFTTGSGAHTQLGLSLLLGLANIRLGYWWDSGIRPTRERATRANFLELASAVLSRILPVQTCLMHEFFARFHGPMRRHWYLSDGGHFENTACYELIRRRVPFIICSDAGQDPHYQFEDLANLVRKARTDFGAEIQIVRRAAERVKDDPGVEFPLPTLEELVHPDLLDVIGAPEDFPSLEAEEATATTARPPAKRHALLARIHYLDDDRFSWLLLIKPSLMGDESIDVVQYQRTHPLFPQEPTSDQYFDEAQWESYRKLGEHIGAELFTPPPSTLGDSGATWSPSEMRPPRFPATPADLLAPSTPRR